MCGPRQASSLQEVLAEAMQDFMLQTVDSYGYLGIFFLIFIENIFPPIPSEAVLLFGGAMTAHTSMNVPGTILAATAGSLAGAVALYFLGYIFQAPRLKRLFAGKVGRVLHLKPEYVDQAVEWFERYQNKAVLICRCIPVVRSLISIPAGCAKMNFLLFFLLTAVGSTVWNTLLVCVGAALGAAWEEAMPYFDQYSHIVLAALALLCVGYVLYRLVKKKREEKK